MLRTTIRPFTDAERERLEAELIAATTEPKPDFAQMFSIAATCAFFGLISGWIIAAALIVLESPALWSVAVMGVGTLTGFVLGWQNALKTSARQVQRRKEYAANLATRLGRGEARETRVTASAVATVSDADGDATGYFFDIGDNRVLFFWDDLPYKYDDLKPASAFTFVRYADEANTVFDFAVTGDALEPSHHFVLEYRDNRSDTYYNGAVFENVTLAAALPGLSATPAIQ